MKKVALYVRVSTEEQKKHGISVDNQIEALQEYCKAHKMRVSGIYNDAGISARKSYKKRPALLKLLNDCSQGKIDLIIFTKLDRWFRSVADYYDVQRLLDEYKVPWKCIWEDYDTQSSTGIFKVNIMLSVAQSEADRTSERINKTFEYKRARGEVCSGGVATGYKIENKKWVKDEKTAPIIEAMFETYLATFSTKATQERLKELNFNTSKEVIRKLLAHHAFYKGLNYVEDAYITKEQHDLIIKSRKVYTRHHKYDFIFSTLCVCGYCGGSMAGNTTTRHNKNGTTKIYHNYTCCRHEKNLDACYGSTFNEEDIEAYMLAQLESEMNSYNMSITSENKDDTKAKLTSAKSKLNRIKNLYELGDIELDEYKEKRDVIIDEINTLELAPEEKIIELPNNWLDIYNSLDNIHKNAFWKRTIDHIEVTGRKPKECKIFF